MNTWDFWEGYKQGLDKFSNREVQGPVTDSSSLLDRGIPKSNDNRERISRFLYCIQQMPRAWGSRPWSSHELIKAGNNVANDLFRRKMKRDLGLR